jgi:heme A synthase
MAIGETQYRTHLPWWLVLIHVGLAGAVWAGIVALATLFRRPLSWLAPGT